MKKHCPACLAPFPAEIANALLEMALARTGLTHDRLETLSEAEKERLDAATWRLVTAADVSETPCGD